MKKGELFIVSGPSGAGKSTICRIVRKQLGINLATSATTRAPREGELHGRDYYFLTTDEFKNKIENNEFLEYATVHTNYYGTLKSEVESRLATGENVILEIDVQGGLQVKEVYPDAHLIFFKTPTKEDLERRLRGRKTDSEETSYMTNVEGNPFSAQYDALQEKLDVLQPYLPFVSGERATQFLEALNQTHSDEEIDSVKKSYTKKLREDFINYSRTVTTDTEWLRVIDTCEEIRMRKEEMLLAHH